MAILRDILDKLSGGSYGKQDDTDLQKVIAERDALKKELLELGQHFNEMFAVTQEIVVAKNELIACLENISAENTMLKAALGAQVKGTEVKN